MYFVVCFIVVLFCLQLFFIWIWFCGWQLIVNRRSDWENFGNCVEMWKWFVFDSTFDKTNDSLFSFLIIVSMEYVCVFIFIWIYLHLFSKIFTTTESENFFPFFFFCLAHCFNRHLLPLNCIFLSHNVLLPQKWQQNNQIGLEMMTNRYAHLKISKKWKTKVNEKSIGEICVNVNMCVGFSMSLNET